MNQYIMRTPGYIFDRPVEQAVIDPENPFVAAGHLRCATNELPLAEDEVGAFGPHAELALRVLEENRKVKRIGGRWYHAASETPQHEVSLRSYADETVTIEDAETKAVLGQVVKFDAQPILHPHAIYMHHGDTYRVLELDLERNVATVKREDVDYYTQPIGGTDVHHVDHRLREKAFGTGRVYWGEITAYFNNGAYEKIHFYSLDAISQHGLDLPTYVLETMALWIVPPEDLMEQVRRAGLEPFNGCRGIGYATRMLLPLFMTCDTLDFSHTVGSANSPWNAIFVYERYPHGLGFTEKAYERLDEVLPAVLDYVRRCPCADGCPCCVGKPLRQYATWNVERGEASIPSKAAALMILEGLLGDQAGIMHADSDTVDSRAADSSTYLEQALRRRLERMREPEVFHPIVPEREVQTEYPQRERDEELAKPDVAQRSERRREFDRDLQKRIAKKIASDGSKPSARGPGPAEPTKPGRSDVRPADPPVRPPAEETPPARDGAADASTPPDTPVFLGDSLAARARKRKKQQEKDRDAEDTDT